MKKWYALGIIGSIFLGCNIDIGSGNTVSVTPPTLNGQAATTSLVPASWCKYIPSKYQHYFPACAPGGNPALVQPVVMPAYSTAANWNDYIKADGSTLCAGTETNYDQCLNGGELKKVVTGETSCDGLGMTDSLAVFDWSCSVQDGVAVFASTMKHTMGLGNIIVGTSFTPMSVTLTKGSSSISSTTTTWWSNAITTLPNNSTDGSAVSVLNSAGTIYVTSSDVLTSGYNIQADKISVVTLNGATIFHNGTAGCNAHLDGSVGNDTRTVIATGSRKYLWLEGNYDENDASSGGTWTIFLSSTVFSKLRLLNVHRGIPVYIYQSNAITADTLTVQDSTDMGIILDTTTNSAVLNVDSENNPIHYGLGMGNANNNYIYNFHANNNFGGIRVYSGSSGNVFDELLITNVVSGIYTPFAGTGNVYSNATVSNVTGSADAAFNIQNADSQILSNILIDTAPNGIMFQISHDTLVSEIKVSNCGVGFFTYDGTGTDISSEVFYDSNTSNCTIIWGNAGYDGSSCAAANDSTFTIVSSSSNVFGYQL